MADNAEKGPDTLRPAMGDDAADLYSSSTVVRDAPSELVELMKQQQKDEGKIPKAPALPKDVSSTKPPVPRPKTEPPKKAADEAKPAVAEGPGRRLDELWDALPRAGDDDDDDDGEPGSGSARLHAAEDVTRMLAIPDDLQIDDKRELSQEELQRIAQAQPSIVVEDGVPSETVSSRPRPPPKVDSEDEIIETSPRKLIPSGTVAGRPLWVVYMVAAALLLAVAIYFAR